MTQSRRRSGGRMASRIGVGFATATVAVLLSSFVALAAVDGDDGSRPGSEPGRAEGAPDLALSMTSDASGPLHSGDKFTYTLTVENVGEAPASGLSVSDTLPLGVAVINLLPVMEGGTCSVILVGEHERQPMFVFCTRDSLAPGASARVTIDASLGREVACGLLTNSAEASARNEPKENVGAENSAEHTTQVDCLPSLALEATGPAAAHVGDLSTFRYQVTNDGDTPLSKVRLADPICDASPRMSSRGNGDTLLSPDETWQYSCTHGFKGSDPDPAAGRATVRAETEKGRSVSASDFHRTDILHPAIRLITHVSPRSGDPGDRVTYTFSVTNRGDAPLFDVRVIDDVLGPVGTLARLERGATATLKATLRLPSDRVRVANSATARGSDALGREVASTEGAAVSVVEASQGGTGSPGGTPFTGADTAGATGASVLLAGLGLLALAAARSRRRSARS